MCDACGALICVTICTAGAAFSLPYMLVTVAWAMLMVKLWSPMICSTGCDPNNTAVHCIRPARASGDSERGSFGPALFACAVHDRSYTPHDDACHHPQGGATSRCLPPPCGWCATDLATVSWCCTSRSIALLCSRSWSCSCCSLRTARRRLLRLRSSCGSSAGSNHKSSRAASRAVEWMTADSCTEWTKQPSSRYIGHLKFNPCGCAVRCSAASGSVNLPTYGSTACSCRPYLHNRCLHLLHRHTIILNMYVFLVNHADELPPMPSVYAASRAASIRHQTCLLRDQFTKLLYIMTPEGLKRETCLKLCSVRSLFDKQQHRAKAALSTAAKFL